MRVILIRICRSCALLHETSRPYKRRFACDAGSAEQHRKAFVRRSSNWTDAAAAAAAIDLWHSCDVVANDNDKFHRAARWLTAATLHRYIR